MIRSNSMIEEGKLKRENKLQLAKSNRDKLEEEHRRRKYILSIKPELRKIMREKHEEEEAVRAKNLKLAQQWLVVRQLVLLRKKLAQKFDKHKDIAV
jgi:hypothetical protein